MRARDRRAARNGHLRCGNAKRDRGGALVNPTNQTAARGMIHLKQEGKFPAPF